MPEQDAPNDVGYAKPPKSGRFTKGRSGNPKGRPRGSRNLASILDEVIREKVRVTEHGKIRTISKLEAIMRQLTAKALTGDLKAIKDVVALKQVFEAVPDQTLQERPDAEKNQAIMRRLVERIRATQSDDSDSVESVVETQNHQETP
jgi:uncharacterized coiled-coil protein SlyX